MKFYGLFRKISKLDLAKAKKTDVKVVFNDGRSAKLDIKYMKDGTPYFIVLPE